MHRTRLRAGRALPALTLTAVLAAGLAGQAAAAPSARGGEDPPPHAANPYVGASVYKDPEWGALAASVPGGKAVRSQPTALWVTAAALDGKQGPGPRWTLRQHLNRAVKKKANLVQIVVVDELARWCPALVSTDLPAPWQGAVDKQRQLVNRLASIEKDPAYASLRFVNMVEIRFVPGIFSGPTGPYDGWHGCASRVPATTYLDALGYTVKALHAVGPNTYQYLDGGHHALYGWDSTFGLGISLLGTIATTAGGTASVDGIVVNLGGYGSLREPWVQPLQTVGGVQLRQSRWVDWNQYTDELTFAKDFRAALVKKGFGAGLGVLVDTGRNGWGGAARPKGPSASTNVDTYVNESRLDRRYDASKWCNQVGAGLGPRPRVAPATWIDAYVWAKAPGTSDGRDGEDPLGAMIPNTDCDPQGSPATDNPRPTGAMEGGPALGAWFPAQFEQLLENAYPPVS